MIYGLFKIKTLETNFLRYEDIFKKLISFIEFFFTHTHKLKNQIFDYSMSSMIVC